ncbi:uncharacterized protein B0P05DRAFT_533393 [Gilbertella persicaria]|uniref:uncharacterized protein n=1 Tax=Gilbertella persicaria TaxID=101096 RepID=UPI00221EB917|nr:uncharacterized protein B0P05DRAFT_533393 [Gilbertella persicaria]KAI8087024.1 hypothetical protein B0P05DRAFT_533393 [Gilbertella persicaria]
MHSIVRSATQTTFKSKWTSFKTWITPDLSKRRASESSTTSSCCSCGSQPTLVEKYMSPFRKRASHSQPETSASDIKQLKHLFQLAIDELKCAQVSRGSAYYLGDRIAAKEAIDLCDQAYMDLLSHLDPSDPYLTYLRTTFDYGIRTLKEVYHQLPRQNESDQISF